MRTTTRLLLAALLLAVFLSPGPLPASFGATATIVDDETGEPIEGAIALAQWVKYKPTGFEGGIPYAAKARETTSNRKGKIYISGYWSWIPFTGKPHLTVYKPGYALWNSEKKAVYPLEYQPIDFSRSNNVVRLVKFEKAAEEWKEIAYSDYVKKYPRSKHAAFLGDCLESGLDTNVLSIRDVFDKYERPFIRAEDLK